MSEIPTYPGTPRWVKLLAVATGILVLAIALVMATGIGGHHGPSRHFGSPEAATPDAAVSAGDRLGRGGMSAAL